MKLWQQIAGQWWVHVLRTTSLRFTTGGSPTMFSMKKPASHPACQLNDFAIVTVDQNIAIIARIAPFCRGGSKIVTKRTPREKSVDICICMYLYIIYICIEIRIHFIKNYNMYIRSYCTYHILLYTYNRLRLHTTLHTIIELHSAPLCWTSAVQGKALQSSVLTVRDLAIADTFRWSRVTNRQTKGQISKKVAFSSCYCYPPWN